MRVLVDLVDSFTGMVRFIILAIILVGLALTLIFTAGVSYVAPKVAEGATERAAQFGELAMEEARNAQREHDLAQDGWGYGSANGTQGQSRSRDGFDSRSHSSQGGGWGDEAE